MIIDRKMAMAEKALADVIDCLNGLVSEQDYEGLRSYTSDPARLMAELEGAREYIHGYARDEGPAPVLRNSDKYPNAMLAREAFLEEHPELDADDAMHTVFGWLYGRPRRRRRAKAEKPQIERGTFAVPGQRGVWNYAVNHAAGKKPPSGRDRA